MILACKYTCIAKLEHSGSTDPECVLVCGFNRHPIITAVAPLTLCHRENRYCSGSQQILRLFELLLNLFLIDVVVLLRDIKPREQYDYQEPNDHKSDRKDE